MTVSFEATPREQRQIQAIVRRAVREGLLLYGLRGALAMDLTACHANGCRLRLGALLTSLPTNFAHDIGGIRAHLNRETGKLTSCFRPRYADCRPEEEQL